MINCGTLVLTLKIILHVQPRFLERIDFRGSKLEAASVFTDV